MQLRLLLLGSAAVSVLTSYIAQAQPISQLPAANSANTTDVIPATQGGVTRKMTVGQINAGPTAAIAAEVTRAQAAEASKAIIGAASGQALDAGRLNQPSGVAGTDANNTISSQTVIASGGTTHVSLATLRALNESVYFLGAVCNGTVGNATQDTAAINALMAAKSAAGGGTVTLPPSPCDINGKLTIPANVQLLGEGPEASSLVATVANLNPMVEIAGNISSIGRLTLKPSAASQATSGVALQFDATVSYAKGYDLNISSPCGGVALNGVVNKLIDVNLSNVQGPGCIGVIVGNLSTGAATTNPALERVTMNALTANPPAAGLRLVDAGGLFADELSITFTGTQVLPGANQQVIWNTIKHSYLGDTGPGPLFLVDTAAASAAVRGMMLVDDWTSSSAGLGVSLANSAGGTVDGVHFIGHRAYGNAGNAVQIASGVLDVSLDNSNICGTSSGGTDVYLLSGASLRATGGHWGGACDGVVAASVAAIGLLFGGSNVVDIQGVDLTGATTPVAGTPTGNSVFANNLPTAYSATALTAAATLTLGPNDLDTISGTTTVTTINGGWQGRRVRIIPSSATPFGTGGNIAAAYTATPNVPIDAQYVGSTWYLK